LSNEKPEFSEFWPYRLATTTVCLFSQSSKRVCRSQAGSLIEAGGLLMVTLTGTVERAPEDGTYTAIAVIGEHTILGDGYTKDEAIEDLRRGAIVFFEYLKSKNQSLPEIVTIDVPV